MYERQAARHKPRSLLFGFDQKQEEPQALSIGLNRRHSIIRKPQRGKMLEFISTFMRRFSKYNL